MSNWYQKMTKTKFGTTNVKILSQIGPKINENVEKLWNLDLSQFFAILRPFKGYQTAVGVFKIARGVTLVPKNAQDNILVQYKSKYWAKMSHKWMKMVKNAKNETSIWVISKFHGAKEIMSRDFLYHQSWNFPFLFFEIWKLQFWDHFYLQPPFLRQ